MAKPELKVPESVSCGEAQSRRWRVCCLSHLAMEKNLFQRPQQLMRELARLGHSVTFVGCVGWKKAARFWAQGVGMGRFEGVEFIHHPYSPFGGMWHGLAAQGLRRQLERVFGTTPPQESRERRVLWLYHPDFARFAEVSCAEVVVYDVMDRFGCFHMSKPAIHEAEAKALESADVIFAGGPSLGRAVRQDLATLGIDKQVHVFPSGVEFEHFAKAIALDTEIAMELQTLTGPILGYIGAIDERIDFELVRGVAQLRPQWSLVFVGPVLRKPDVLPGNVYFLGARPYDHLPRYLKGIDVCLLPFCRSPLVAHVSPTKTPEYLAAGCPVVSTCIPDVVDIYGDIVRVADSVEKFVAAIEAVLREGRPPEVWLQAARRRASTWREIATEMVDLVEQSVPNRRVASGIT